jgi:hypothetical protein
MFRSFEAGENNYYTASEINEIIRNDDFINCKYKKVTIVIPTEKSTLVPAQLYNPEKKDEYFRFNHLHEKNMIIFSNKLSTPDAYTVFEVPEYVHNTIMSLYPNITPVHHLKPLLNHVCQIGNSSKDNYIHLHFEKDFFNLIILNSKDLHFCNSFNYKNTNDILYYVMNVLKSYEINQETTIHFSGLAGKYDDLVSAFSTYIKRIKFSQPFGNFTFSNIFNSDVLHRYINLFNLPNCE